MQGPASLTNGDRQAEYREKGPWVKGYPRGKVGAGKHVAQG